MESCGGSRRGGTTTGPLSTGALRIGIVYERPARTRVLERPFAWRIAADAGPVAARDRPERLAASHAVTHGGRRRDAGLDQHRVDDAAVLLRAPVVEAHVQVVLVTPLVLDDPLLAAAAEDVGEPAAVLALRQRLVVEHADQRAVDEDALDVGLRDQRPHEGPGARRVEVLRPCRPERVGDSPLR